MSDTVARADMAQTEERYEVFSPEGLPGTRAPAALRTLERLNDAIVAEVWTFEFRGDEIFEVVEEELTRSYPGIRFVRPSVFGAIHGPTQAAVVDALPEALRENGCNAVLVGMGA